LGKTWRKINDGIPQICSGNRLDHSYQYVFVLTQSSGIFRAKLSDLGISIDAVNDSPRPQPDEITLAPVPAGDYLAVTLLESLLNEKISVYDILGLQVASYTIGQMNLKIDTSNLPAGTYILRAGNKSKVVVKI
jgi:hypothetical protein